MSAVPVMKVKCPSCPFRAGSKFAHITLYLTESNLTECTRICHSTGENDEEVFGKRIHKEDHLCRGARDLQLEVFHGMGFISEPTDEAWNAKCIEMGLPT